MTLLPFARAVLIGAAGFAATGLTPTGFATPAHAQNYPWCLQSAAYEGGENCGFTSFDQCMATRLGIGGFCQQNDWYKGANAASPAPSHKRRSKNS
jgi:uncharacterized protein DUF3551